MNTEILNIFFLMGVGGIALWIFIIKQKLKKRTIQLQELNQKLENMVTIKTKDYQAVSEELIKKNKQLDGAIEELLVENKRNAQIAAQLEINEEKYRSFVIQSGDGTAIINSQGKIIEWNRKMELITGVAYEEAFNREMWELEFNVLPLAERTVQRMNSLRAKYQADLSLVGEKDSFMFEQEILNSRKEHRKIMSLIFPILTKNHRYVGCITRDITNEINQKENEFGAKLLQLVQNLVLVLDTEGRIIRFNDAYEKITGYTKDEIFYKLFWEIHHPFKMRERVKADFLSTVKLGVPYEINTEIHTKTGEIRKVLWKFNSINDDHGSYKFLIFSGTDMTELRKKEEELKVSEQKFRNMFEKNLTGVLLYEPVLDENDKITDVKFIEANSALEEQTGVPQYKLMGKTFREIYPDEDLFFIKDYELFKKNGRYLNYEQFIPRLDKYFRVQHFEMINGLMAATFDNVTEQKRMEQKLIETVVNIEERGLKRIARDLHDEVGPQLASMNVYVSSLLRKIDNPEQQEILQLLKDLIKESIAHVREISNNLTPHIIEKYGLIMAINSEIESMRFIMPVTFKHNFSDERFDPKIEISVYRIVKELLNNTKKYAHASNVDVNINIHDNILFIAYQDDGVGFNLETKMNNGDVGMGLLNIESRVKAIHGKFFILTEPSKGFIFSMDVPINPKKLNR